MVIKIKRNDAGNCINFLGTSNPVYWNGCLSASVNPNESNSIDIVNDIRSVEGETKVYEFYQIPYTEFVDGEGNTFSTPQECIDYINLHANTSGNTGKFILSSSDTMDFKLDNTETTILVDNGDNYSVNSISAVLNSDNKINITTHEGDIIIYRNLEISNVTINTSSVNSDGATAVNELNGLFTHTFSTGTVPVITSSLTISLTEGETLNYTATATDAVAWEWSGLPSGVATVDGNIRNIIGGSSLAQGSYNITLKAINYYGYDEETIVLTVAAPPFSDTKSVHFPNSNDYLIHNNTGTYPNLTPQFQGIQKPHDGNASNWSVSFWFKATSNTSVNQSVFAFASHDGTWDNYIELRWKGAANLMRYFELYINDNSQSGGQGRLVLETPVGGPNGQYPITANTWHHVVITNGGTTYTSSGHQLNFYLNGTRPTNPGGNNLILTNETGGGVTTGTIDARYLLMSKSPGNGNHFWGNINEFAYWDDELTQTEVTTLYNNGNTRDLSVLPNPPQNWWRMGDGDTFSTLQDNISTADLTMVNMTAGDIVSDVP